ncbi:aminotransferase class III-fold pyridoxal phosphate-dependent enzyme, partial [Pseudomonas aeruginosa]|uniref:aminotransferase class III-fold pyridoxal phosphate-dependent enzyme n=1 Tax=Pseudomonas aeruginosa TaxID=287 RepID=UPI003CC6C475
LEGFARVPFHDLDAMAAAIDEVSVAVLLEAVQGDAGVIPATLHYLRGIERLGRQRGVVLILDEVQTGMGRCGALLA